MNSFPTEGEVAFEASGVRWGVREDYEAPVAPFEDEELHAAKTQLEPDKDPDSEDAKLFCQRLKREANRAVKQEFNARRNLDRTAIEIRGWCADFADEVSSFVPERDFARMFLQAFREFREQQ